MPTYYCHACAATQGHLQNVQTGAVLLSKYQLDNYMKHTIPDPKYPLQSVFAQASTGAYAKYFVNAELAGSVEIDDQNRKNIIWVAGKTVGFLYQNGKLVQPEDCVKVVLSTSTGEIHAFSQSSTQFQAAKCASCGQQAVR